MFLCSLKKKLSSMCTFMSHSMRTWLILAMCLLMMKSLRRFCYPNKCVLRSEVATNKKKTTHWCAHLCGTKCATTSIKYDAIGNCHDIFDMYFLLFLIGGRKNTTWGKRGCEKSSQTQSMVPHNARLNSRSIYRTPQTHCSGKAHYCLPNEMKWTHHQTAIHQSFAQ